jgi:hypothetical protein
MLPKGVLLAMLGFTLAGVVGKSATTRADEIGGGEIVVPTEPPPPAAAPAPEEPEVRQPCCTLWPLGYFDETVDAMQAFLGDKHLTMNSGLSTSFQWDFNEPSSYKAGLREFSDTHSRYFVDLWQLTLANTPDPEPGDFGGLVQLDAGRYARDVKADWNGTGVIPDQQWEFHEFELQQAFVTYNIPIGRGLTLKGGKLNMLVGVEEFEPWNNPNYSRSFLYDFGQPYTFTGGTLSYPFTDMVELEAGAAVGWNNFEDNNDSATAVGALRLTPNDKFSLKVGGIIGPEQSCDGAGVTLPDGQGCNSNYRGIVDVVTDMQPHDDVNVKLAYLYGSEDEASAVSPGRHATWSGFEGVISYDFLDCFTAAVRGEWFQDAQGSRTAANLDRIGVRPQRLTLWEVSADLKAMLSEHIYVRTEYRHDEADDGVFLSGKTILRAGQDTVAFELGYHF